MRQHCSAFILLFFLVFFDYSTPPKKIKRPQGISFPEPLEPPPAEMERAHPLFISFSYRLSQSNTIVPLPVALQAPFSLL
ncbi:hypothetical protein GBM56_15635 [Enterococcus faecium]|nr:hypothetical protein GBM56_15635 [Enterococcus faecium]KAB7623264.1 hypothetical protein GBM39_15315 [Enterococcus faecium]